MTTAREDIRDGIRDAVGILGEGETWYYRLLTSQPGITPKTYSSWIALSARRDNRTKAREYDQTKATTQNRARCTITVYDTQVLAITFGDQLKDSDDIIWAFEAVVQSGIGIEHWELARDIPLMQGAENRGGL